MGTMSVICSEGDIVVEWDPADEESTKNAKAEWDRLKADGYEFFEPHEVKGKRLSRFDKKRGRVIAAPGVATKADKQADTRRKAMRGGPNASIAVAGPGPR